MKTMITNISIDEKDSKQFNKDEITAKELIIYLRRNMLNQLDVRFEDFCTQYANRDVSTVIQYLKKHTDIRITPTIIGYFKEQLSKEADRIRARRRANRAEEDINEIVDYLSDSSK